MSCVHVSSHIPRQPRMLIYCQPPGDYLISSQSTSLDFMASNPGQGLNIPSAGLRQPGFCLSFNWKLRNWIDFYSDLNCNESMLVWGSLISVYVSIQNYELHWFLFRFKLKLKNIGLRKPDICWNFNWQLLTLNDFCSDLKWKWKDVGLGQPDFY